MKTKLKITLAIAAGCIAATTLFGQSEQWLEYHTSDQGRAYVQLKLTTNPPADVALPKFNAQPYFAQWKTPMDPAGARWLCFDRTRQSGPYDRLFIDASGSGRLDDKEPVKARIDSYNAYFPATALTFKGEDGPITYHIAIRFYQYQTNQPQVLISSAGWYEGLVNFGNGRKRIQLIDGNVNGTFDDIAADPYSSDRVRVDGDKTGERFLGKLLEVDGRFYEVAAAHDGAFVKIQRAENVTVGAVRVPENISEFTAFGANGHFVRQPKNGQFTLPIGDYRMVGWTINRNDEKGAPWTLSGYDFPKTATFSVATNETPQLQIGEPVRAELEVANTGGREMRFSLHFVGQQKESIEMLRDKQRPRGPKLMLANADGSLCYTNTFEFG